MEHKVFARYPLGNPRRVWRQDNFILSTFSAVGQNMRGILQTCADAGFNLIETGGATHEQAEEAIRICEELQLDLILQDNSLYGGMQKRQMDRAQLSASDARQICDRIRPWRHVIGYYIWDEPYGEGQLERARRETDLFQFADPTRVPFNVAIPSYNDKFTWQNGEFADYLDRYCRIIDPAILSLDYYPIGLSSYTDEGQLDNSFMWLDLGLMRNLGRTYAMPVWFYYQGMNLYRYHRFTFPMVRMNMYSAVLYGAKGLQQFKALYSTVKQDGTPDVFFDDQRQIHREFKMLGGTLMALENVNVIHSDDLLPGCEHMAGLAETMADSRHLVGTLPNRVSIGEFEDAYGNQYLLVLNRDYETDAAITLDLKENCRIYEVSRITGKQNVIWDETRQINVSLAKGDAILYRIQPAAEEAFTVEYRLEK